jgi:GDP-L-fucose synthase
MHKDSKIFVAGHKGLVGSAIVRVLSSNGYSNILVKTRNELDLTNKDQVDNFFETNNPEYVFLAAAKVGGILANSTYPVDFLLQNLQIQNNVISSSARFGTRKVAFLGSSCIYPKYCPQPIKEEYLLTGELEKTNQPYAIAKIAGIELIKAYRIQSGLNGICIMPTNLYGINDNFDLRTSHVLPALIRKFHEAKENKLQKVTVWGTGLPKREFLHVDDLANATLFLMNNYNSTDIVNVGVGTDIRIADLARLVAEVIGFSGEITFDTTKPDGTPQKLLDTTRIRELGWIPQIELRQGVLDVYEWYKENLI